LWENFFEKKKKIKIIKILTEMYLAIKNFKIIFYLFLFTLCSINSGCSFSRFNLEKEHPLFIEHFPTFFLENKK